MNRPAPPLALLALAVAVATFGLLAMSPATAPPETVPAGFVDEFVSDAPSPTALAQAPGPDRRVLVGSQEGRLWWLGTEGRVEPAALDLSSKTCAQSERGLLGVAFDPDFAGGRPYLYVFYTFRRNGSCGSFDLDAPVNRVSRFRVEGQTILAGSETVIVDSMPSFAGNHNGGDVAFGPDGFLYISIGDSGCDYTRGNGCAAANDAARDRHILLGKILRVTRDGAAPAGNPFTDPATSGECRTTGRTDPGKHCRETYAWGLRNPFRIAVDPDASPASPRIFVNDVGQNAREEIDLLAAGADYGWNVREGRCATGGSPCGAAPAGMTNPVFDYAQGECGSITGGAFVPDGDGGWPAEFDDDYLYADFNCNRIFRLRQEGGGTWVSQSFAANLGGGGPVTLRFLAPATGSVADAAALYYTTYARGGELRRIRSTSGGGANRRPTARLAATPPSGPTPLAVRLDGADSSDPDGDALSAFHWDFGDGSSGETTAAAAIEHVYASDGAFTARLRVEDEHGLLSTEATRAILAGDQPPAIRWLRPLESFRFAARQNFAVAVAVEDPEEGVVPGSRVSIRALLHHDQHAHPFLPTSTGKRLRVTAPEPEDLLAAETNRLEFIVEASDAAGNTAELRRFVEPKKVTLTLRTEPAGLRVTANAIDFVGPSAVTSWPGVRITLEAPAQRKGGVRWVFDRWSDGGAATHEIVTGSSNRTLTARFRRAG